MKTYTTTDGTAPKHDPWDDFAHPYPDIPEMKRVGEVYLETIKKYGNKI